MSYYRSFDEANSRFLQHRIMQTCVYRYIPMNRPKILPKRTTNSGTNRISGYLSCVKLTYTPVGPPPPKVDISVHKVAKKLEINISML